MRRADQEHGCRGRPLTGIKADLASRECFVAMPCTIKAGLGAPPQSRSALIGDLLGGRAMVRHESKAACVPRWTLACRLGRVNSSLESRTGAVSPLIGRRFQSPLIEPDKRLYRIRPSSRAATWQV